MADLRLAMALMAFLSVASFLGVRRLCAKAGPRVLDTLAAALVLIVGVYIRFVWGQLWIVEWIPLPSVVILANWFPVLLGMLAAILWLRMQSNSIPRRIPIQLLLVGATVWSEIYVIPRKPPKCGNEWIEPTAEIPFRICLQTTPYTCSAASAATILHSLGIPSSEKEMAELCLTGEGTTWLGLYHGLSIRLQGSGYGVEFFEGNLADLDVATAEFPVLLCCRLSSEVDIANPNYRNEAGWKPGVAHSAVLFGCLKDFNEIVYVVGDPSQKHVEFWSQQDVENLWTGQGLRVVTARR
ncbi:MAG: hypothetical protein H7Z17_19215 [Fuerstia sp.]|nr:hypothetical protein [Fuerstiella sp.]